MPERVSTPGRLEILAISGLSEISPGEPLAELLCGAIRQSGLALEDGDVVVVAQRIVSKAEGQLVKLDQVEPSPAASSLAETLGKDPRHVEIILRESKRVVRMEAGLIITETRHGLICANAGVDTSNVPAGWVCLLPVDPDRSARCLQEEITSGTGKRVAVIISDTFGRPWREGLTNVAVGVAGLHPLLDYRGQQDQYGRSLVATVIAVADELAAAAELVMGKTARRPAAIIRHFVWLPHPGSGTDLIRPRERDLFR